MQTILEKVTQIIESSIQINSNESKNKSNEQYKNVRAGQKTHEAQLINLWEGQKTQDSQLNTLCEKMDDGSVQYKNVRAGQKTHEAQLINLWEGQKTQDSQLNTLCEKMDDGSVQLKKLEDHLSRLERRQTHHGVTVMIFVVGVCIYFFISFWNTSEASDVYNSVVSHFTEVKKSYCIRAGQSTEC